MEPFMTHCVILAVLLAQAAAPQTTTPAGRSATQAVGVQGVTNGIPIPVTGVAGATSDVTLHDNATPGNHLGIDAAGKLGVNNFPASFDVTDRIARLVGHVICDSGCSGGSSDLALTSAADETLATRAAVTAALRLRDTSLGANAQLIGWRGDATSGAWVNIKNSSIAVTGTFWQATQPVSGTFWQATQPVSGTFWQATQPVSGTVTANQGGAPWSDDPTDRAARLLGHVTVDNASIAVTGTFWQATQPVSGTFFQATQPVSIATMPSTPVTGTFWQATQPVSATSLPLPTGAATDVTDGETHGVLLNPAPAKMDVIGGVDSQGRSQQIALAPGGIIYVQALPGQPINPFLPRCNPVRRTNCQP